MDDPLVGHQDRCIWSTYLKSVLNQKKKKNEVGAQCYEYTGRSNAIFLCTPLLRTSNLKLKPPNNLDSRVHYEVWLLIWETFAKKECLESNKKFTKDS